MWCKEREGEILYLLAIKSCTEKVSFSKNPKRSEGARHADLSESFPGKSKCKCKGLKMRPFLGSEIRRAVWLEWREGRKQ